ncbi:hypothetical protein NQ176_g9310 [Zarea fungicola]|uniref:Uncharacterized protein n=1 Tax=Zarea fungicola TaxID=93591 RepID=A0ACC1MMX8_9HYPO|nr:hypothetical protein NQ176_g9310 [Lecanicillium fungicola]
MSQSNNSGDDYVLGRGAAESVRLDAQHLLWKIHLGHLLHPSIKVTENLKIAEIGCGTAIWLLHLSHELPPTVKLYGFDVSSKQYPPKELWPENLCLLTMDSLKSPPADLMGQFDVVHVRMWASNVTRTTLPTLVSHIRSLLKPGGYLQWEEANLTRQVVVGAKAQEFETHINSLFKEAGLDYSWVTILPEILRDEKFSILKLQEDTLPPSLRQLGTNTYLLALQEIIRGIRSRLALPKESTYPYERALAELLNQHTSGIIYNWGPTFVLAQSSLQ